MVRTRDNAAGNERGIAIDRCKTGDYMTGDYSSVIIGRSITASEQAAGTGDGVLSMGNGVGRVGRDDRASTAQYLIDGAIIECRVE